MALCGKLFATPQPKGSSFSKNQSCGNFSRSLADINKSNTYNWEIKYLSKWIPSAIKPKATLLLVHGLNLQPSRMDPIANFLSNYGVDVLRVSLSGHKGDKEEAKAVTRDKWLKDVWAHYCIAKKRSQESKTPLHLLGFSLGGLISTDLMNHMNSGEVHFDKQVLIAPAITPYWYAKIPANLKFLPDSMFIPSRNDREYRVFKGTSVASYRALVNSVEKTMFSKMANSNIPTLVLIDPEDELVSFTAMKELTKKHSLTNWTFETLSNHNSKLNKPYHHLIIDRLSLGEEEWEIQKLLIKNHLNL
jgi:alpha-beta hydrolase superfamily lysophospholipase